MIEQVKELSLDTINSIQARVAENSEVGAGELANKLDQLFPSIYIIIATLGSLIILLIILTKFLYKPVSKMVENRKNFIKNNINQSIEAKEKAFSLENEAKQKLLTSQNTGQELISKAKIEAEVLKNMYIEQGKAEAERLVKEAKEGIEAKKKSLEKDSYNEIVSIALEISEKIVEKNISDKVANKYLDEYLETKKIGSKK